MGIDLGVVLLPLPIVWRLQMSSRKKNNPAKIDTGCSTSGQQLNMQRDSARGRLTGCLWPDYSDQAVPC
jgi:secreted protein with Ig-like and vWFA domain